MSSTGPGKALVRPSTLSRLGRARRRWGRGMVERDKQVCEPHLMCLGQVWAAYCVRRAGRAILYFQADIDTDIQSAREGKGREEVAVFELQICHTSC